MLGKDVLTERADACVYNPILATRPLGLTTIIILLSSPLWMYVYIYRRYILPMGDFPNVHKFRQRLRELDKDLRSFTKLDKVRGREGELFDEAAH